MATDLKLLLLEDNPDDSALVLRQLKKAGFAVNHRQLDTQADFLAALGAESWDLILSDFHMPQFTGLRAFELLRERDTTTPFIVISGTIGEETAVEVMRLGVTDYLLKDRLARLPAAVERALRESRLQRERRQREEDFRLLFAQNPMPMWVYELEGLQFLAVNDAAVAHYGYSRDEFLRMTLRDIRPPAEIPRMLESIRHRPADVTRPGIWRHSRKDGTEIMAEITAHRTTFQGRPAELVLANDVTERLAAERALRESEGRLRTVTDNAQVGLVMVDADRRYTFANNTYAEMLGLPGPDIAGLSVADVLAPLYEEQIRSRLDRALAGERVVFELNRTTASGTRHFTVRYEPTRVDGTVSLVVVVITDITERVQADQRIREQLAELMRWQEVMLGREDRVQALKDEVNALLLQQKLPPRYGGDQSAP